jgi:hypothetical protein
VKNSSKRKSRNSTANELLPCWFPVPSRLTTRTASTFPGERTTGAPVVLPSFTVPSC